MNTQTTKCTHTHVCQECLKEEIKQAEIKLKELKDKLPNQGNTYIIQNQLPCWTYTTLF